MAKETKEKGKEKKLAKPKKNIFSRVFAEALELPRELALDMPKITLIGNVRLDVENHKGIINYSKEQVKLKVNNGFLCAGGKNLTLKNISREEVALEGEIRTISIVLDGEYLDDTIDMYDLGALDETSALGESFDSDSMDE